MYRRLAAALLTVLCMAAVPGSKKYSSAESVTVPEGWLLWHSYTSYSAMDSQLFVRDPDGETTEIKGNFIHAMNGNFGDRPDKIVFMAIDQNADEWDIFVSDNGKIKNLTEKSGYRNEDPKWSPDGKSIVFKRGYWNPAVDDFTYDLALLDAETLEVTMITDDTAEEVMPYFSEDGKYIYYTSYNGKYGSVVRMNISDKTTETLFKEESVNAYYPVYKNGVLYFTRWISSEDHHDEIVQMKDGVIQIAEFNSEKYDCSDACPVEDGKMIYSSTANGAYSLYYFNGIESVEIPGVNSSGNELGADFFPYTEEKISSESSDILYEEFDGSSLDSDIWLVSYKNWGGKVTDENGKKVDYNGGVLPQNISLRDGKLILHGNGNLYTGDIKGINRDRTERADGKRTGAAVATKNYYASGSYEVMAKIAPEMGVCSAIWTFEYEEDEKTGKITNHEIDIEMPGKKDSSEKEENFRYALCNTWTGEAEGEYLSSRTDTGLDQADGKFHKYRFDWHTGDDNETPRVEFYFDDVLIYTSYEHIPVNEGRLWIGLWFPNGWAGTPDFDTAEFEIEYVKITPFHEKGDSPQNETYGSGGWGNVSDIRRSADGDVNDDGVLSAEDILLLRKYLLSGEPLKSPGAADLDHNGSVNICDYCLMKNLILLS